ncbi:MAG: arginine--tRNA ligase [Helicobacteraceae bacterium]|nr:arginine--tRNA ligase [Helicobacteraceae bacterium]
MYYKIKDILDSTLQKDVILEIPKDSKIGHLATPIAFILAKELKKNPSNIAKDLIKKLQHYNEFENIREVNGFINFTLSKNFLADISSKLLENPNSFIKEVGSKSILLEFVSANPTGPLHIGHARGAIFGDTLARIGRKLGYKITTEYYINDAGSQIDMLGLSIYLTTKELLGQEVQYPESYYRGEYINNIAKKAKDIFDKNLFLNPLDSAFCKELGAFGVNEILFLIKENLKNANIEFDNFVSEKVLSKDMSSTLEKLEQNNALYNEDSKVWLKSSLKGDEKDRVVIRENGEPTYLAGDIIYHNDKFKRGFDSYINIWGADHHGYIARINASIDFLGYDSSKLEVLLSQMVSLLKAGKPFKMSKRAGNFILMQDVIDEIGIDAMRFIFITKKADTHLEFDLDFLKSEDSNNPLYYINYANARIHTILNKSSVKNGFEFEKIDSAIWIDLLIYALLLPKFLESSFSEKSLQKLPEYLKNLASKLHFCYNSSKIIGNSFEGEILSILKIVSLSITTGLSCMGIVAKIKM